jgi:hypothetical protein
MNMKTLTIITIALFAACTNTRDTKNAPRVSPTNYSNTGTNSGYKTGANSGAMNTDSDTNANSDSDTGMYPGDNTGTATNNGVNSGSATGTASNSNTGTNSTGATAKNDQSSYTPYTRGDLTITPVYQDSMVIKVGGKTIYVNPRYTTNTESQAKADLILFTVMPEETVTDTFLGEIKTQTAVIYAPQAVSDKYPGQMKVISIGKKETWKSDITIEAPNGNGYILTVDKQRVYVSGEAECFAKVTTIKNLDRPILTVGKTTVFIPGPSEEVVTCLGESK